MIVSTAAESGEHTGKVGPEGGDVVAGDSRAGLEDNVHIF